MQLTQENPGFAHVPRGVVPGGVLVDQRTLERSFLLAPDRLVEDWRPTAAADLQPADFDAVLALQPALVLLGTGERQRFPPAAAIAAARTFNVLATEGRRVVAGFLLPG